MAQVDGKTCLESKQICPDLVHNVAHDEEGMLTSV